MRYKAKVLGELWHKVASHIGSLPQNLRPDPLQLSNNNGKLLERLFDQNVYFKAYRPYALDQQAELARWRQAGARTPAAPPPPPAAK